jgi:protein RecA
LHPDIEDILRASRKELKRRKSFSFGLCPLSTAWDDGAGDVRSWIPTGITLIDASLGGGFPLGRMSELYSVSEAEGKTTLSLHLAISVQRRGGLVIWWESESALDKLRAQSLGLDLRRTVFWGPSCLEDGFDCLATILDKIRDSDRFQGLPILIVWDTIAQCPPRAELKGDTYADGMAKRSRIISEALRRYTNVFWSSGVHFLIVNQMRTDLQRKTSFFGPRYDTAGGKAIKFAATLRVRVRRAGWVREVRSDDGSPMIGIKVSVVAEKNKLFFPFRDVPTVCFGDRGYSDAYSLAEYFLEQKRSDMIEYVQGGRYKVFGGKKLRFSEIEALSEKTLERWREEIWKMFPLPQGRVLDQESGWVVPVIRDP